MLNSTASYCPPCSPPEHVETSNRAVRDSSPTESPAFRPLSLRKNFLWMSAGNAVDSLCQWARVVILAYLGGLEMVGMVALAFAVCAPVYALASLSLRAAMITDAKREYQFGDYLALRLVMAALALLTILGIVLATGYERETALLILIVGAAELLKSLSEMFHSCLQRHERMDRIAVAVMIRAVAMLALLTLGVYLTGSVLWGVAGFPLVAAAILFGYDIPNGSRIIRNSLSNGTTCQDSFEPRWNLRTMFQLVWLTLPLGIVLMMISLTTSIPRCMVDAYLGKHAVGVFVSIICLGTVGLRVVNAMGQSVGPRLATYYAAGNVAAYLRLLGRLLAIVGGLGVAAVVIVGLLGEPILGMLYNEDYGPYLDLAVYLMVAAAMLYLTIPLGRAVEAMRRFRTHMVIRTAAILVMLVLMPGLIETYGLCGAAWAMIGSLMCSILGCAGVILWSACRSGKIATLPSQPVC